jgi:rhodanese-related sulfurtransferase
MLMDRGYARVRPLEGGLEAWIEAGGPIENIDKAN